ncbi:hypothetical protein [Nocardia transvalensis]|uniref:hypothetical protein n=1 Tax=Nocardia transvalensis TaxID=37333 RepID=UPI003A5CF4B4
MVAVAAVLVVVQLVVRGWVAGRGFFYWDDLILVGRAGAYPVLSSDLLLYNHDGHFMPLAFVTAWVVTHVAPLVWAGPVVSLLMLQAAASVAVLRMLLVLVPAARARWVVLVPFVFYLFCPLTLPAYAWWAAGLNALPLQFALAWVIADAVLLVRTGRRRYAVSGIVVVAVALLFFEKSVVVPFVAFAVAALVRCVDGRGAAVRVVLRHGAALWAGSGLVLLCWLAVYCSVAAAAVHERAGLRGLLNGATSLGIVPALLGGPWVWERWLPSTPWAAPPGWAVVAAWVALGIVVALTIRARLRVIPVWVAAVGYVVAAQIPVVLVRGGPDTAAELTQSLRYLADVAVVLTALGALLLHARPSGRIRLPCSVVVALTAAFVASSLWSTGTFARSWSVSPTRTYLTNAKSALAAHGNAPLLDQEVPWDVLSPLTSPQNQVSRVLSATAPAGTFANSTPRLRMFTDTGELVDGQVWWNRAIRPGPEPGCGYRIDDAQPVDIALDGPMLERGWTAQLNYFADRDGRITVAFEHGRAVVAPVQAGLHTVFVRLVGSGEILRIGSRTPGLDLCLGTGPVGVASFDP